MIPNKRCKAFYNLDGWQNLFPSPAEPQPPERVLVQYVFQTDIKLREQTFLIIYYGFIIKIRSWRTAEYS